MSQHEPDAFDRLTGTDDPTIPTPPVQAEHPLVSSDARIGQTQRDPSGCVWPSACVVMAFMFCVTLVWVINRIPSTGPTPNDNHSHVEPTDDDSQVNPSGDYSADIQGGWLVFVIENAAPTTDQTEAMAAYGEAKLSAIGMEGFRRYDEEQAAARAFIDWGRGRGLATPAVFLVKDRDIKRGGPFETLQDIEEFLRQ